MLEVKKCMMVKAFHLMGLSNDGVTYLTKDNKDDFIIQMLILEKLGYDDGAIQYEMPNDEYNRQLLSKARALFSFVDGVFGIGWNRDLTDGNNKIQFYKMPKIQKKKHNQFFTPARGAWSVDET